MKDTLRVIGILVLGTAIIAAVTAAIFFFPAGRERPYIGDTRDMPGYNGVDPDGATKGYLPPEPAPICKNC